MVGLNAQYVLYGTDLDNEVVWIGDGSDDAWKHHQQCTDFAAAVNEGGYTHVLIGRYGPTEATVVAQFSSKVGGGVPPCPPTRPPNRVIARHYARRAQVHLQDSAAQASAL